MESAKSERGNGAGGARYDRLPDRKENQGEQHAGGVPSSPGSAASVRLHFLGRFGDSDGGAQFAGHADEKAFRELVATLHVDHPVGMSGIADNNAFLAGTDDSGGSLLTLHFSQQERVEILRLAAALKKTPEQLIREIIRRHLPHDVAGTDGTDHIPWL